LVLPVAGQSIDSLGRKLFQALGELRDVQAGRSFIG
jgi:hypothetical protein